MGRSSILRGVALAALLTGLTYAHPDVIGTRYVAGGGSDVGPCDDNHAPCRSLLYAIQHAEPGNGIKVAAGTYDVTGLDIGAGFFGKEGIRGGYTADDHFHDQDPLANATYLKGVEDPRYAPLLLAAGFVALDANGQEIPREVVQSQPPATCTNGMAGQFPCWNIDFLSQVPLTSFNTQPLPLSAANLWGFVHDCDAVDREYAVIGLNTGTAVVDVTDPANPVHVGIVPGVTSAWREVKVLQVEAPGSNCDDAYAYISTEGPGGLQILDLSNLPTTVTLANTLNDYSSSHTLYISNVDYATNKVLPGRTPFLYVAGSNLLNGRYRIYDLTNPTSPQLVTVNPGNAALTETRGFYMHDSTSLLITDNRTTQCANGHNPCEVLVDFNEQSVDLWDVTDKANPAFLSRTIYQNARYTHSGWPTADQQFLIVHDELDEVQVPGLLTSIYTLDIRDLRNPSPTVSYTGTTTTTDHNGYTIGNRYYVSHYKRGLVIFDVTNPLALREVGFFDTLTFPAENTSGFNGSWGVYPFLPSGTLLVSNIEGGLFVLRRNETTATPPTPPAPPAPPPPAGGGGGGGVIGGWMLLALAATAAAVFSRSSPGSAPRSRPVRAAAPARLRRRPWPSSRTSPL
jgi:choice-of-anchor B domain-containing protein